MKRFRRNQRGNTVTDIAREFKTLIAKYDEATFLERRAGDMNTEYSGGYVLAISKKSGRLSVIVSRAIL
jgi:hypothetical protein